MYLPWDSAVLHPDRMWFRVPLSLHKLHLLSSQNHLLLLAGVYDHGVDASNYSNQTIDADPSSAHNTCSWSQVGVTMVSGRSEKIFHEMCQESTVF